MAARSPSPNPSRPSSSRPKTPEVRRSGGFNLSKSSSNEENHWRSSVSKAGRDLQPSLRSSFEKENNNEVKTPRPRSPAVSKGSVKSFMAPTISAASKSIAAASPRKKILGERNEVISVSSSLEFPRREEIGARAESQSVSWPDFGEILGGAESRNSVGETEIKNKKHHVDVPPDVVEPEIKAQKHHVDVPPDVVEPEIKAQKHVVVPSFTPSPAAAAPLDVDPSPNRPYDPQTNYLSPRPRFLCYRPNPRVEQYKEGGFVEDGKNLEDSLSFESSEDDEEEEEEPSFAEVVVEEVTTEPPASEPQLQSKPITNNSKSRPSARLKSVPFLLVLVMASLYAPLSDSPLISSSPIMLKTRSFVTSALPVLHDEYLKDYIALANVHLNELANQFRHWSINTIAYVASITSHPNRELGSFSPSNLTFSEVDQTVGADFIYSSAAPNQGNLEIEADQSVDDSVVVQEESHFEHVAAEVSEDTEQIEPDSLEDVEENAAQIEWEKMTHDDGTEAVEEVIHQMEDTTDDDSMEKIVPRDEGTVIEPVEDELITPEISEYEETLIEPIASEDVLHQENLMASSPEIAGCEVIVIDPVGSSDNISGYREDSLEHLVVDSEEKLSGAVVGVALAMTVVAATMVVAFMKKKIATLVIANEGISPKSVCGSSERCKNGKGSPSQNFHADMEVVGDAGPSEASSSLHSSSYSRQQRTTKRSKGEEALSNERRTRRDSMVSSSVSYGSFTTYEKLSGKEGCGDEDVGTPVRRSSRLRNHIVSP